MQSNRLTKVSPLFTFIALLGIITCKAQVNADRSWSIYKANENSSNYSPLNQITTATVNQLQLAWTFNMHDKPAGSQPGKSECNPIIVDGILYATSANQWAYAVNAATGKQVWSFDPLDGKQGSEVNRGLTYWQKGKGKRIFMSANNYLFALDARRVNLFPHLETKAELT